ncbi:carboxypeptidase regulatory-like domain-containing protein [Cellvibrio sp. NN19]|uniref:carboxypeptidase regulatory-like domain-containing protein n=1 Tax=Cellvibrio chitinivorans TaxID=3102792 RepID=UPI002B40B9E4|nr:carboxypeptidase regulatory-like domain-containing protein [Cellvibrio sp. NN19]
MRAITLCLLLSTSLLAACGGSSDLYPGTESSSRSSSSRAASSVAPTTVETLTGTVNNYYTGTPIAEAEITVTALDENDNVLMSATTQTDANGAYSVEELGVHSRFVLSIRKTGFATRTEILSNFTTQTNINRSSLLLVANPTTAFSADSATSVIINNDALIELPANALVNADGTAVNGDITPTITIIDPSGDAGIMPGNYQARDTETGTISLIESFGAIDINFRDANDNLLQLAENTSATISIPLASGVRPSDAPATVPLYYFNESTGYWIKEGEATLTTVGNKHFYRGEVTHFSTWNADLAYETINVTGCIRNASNNPLSNVRIIASGRDFIGQSTAYSNSSGSFEIPVRINSSILLNAIATTQSDTITTDTETSDLTVSTCLELAEGSAAITLTWGENPDDLDSHWFIPNAAGTLEYEVDYTNKSEEVNGVVFDLDVDDTTGFGPEVVTIPDFPHAGTYRYVIHLFSGDGTIADSPTRVELNLRGNIYIFSASDAIGDQTAEYWHVFNIQVDGGGNTTVVNVQQFSDGDSLARASAMGVRSLKSGDSETAPKLNKVKHYAE